VRGKVTVKFLFAVTQSLIAFLALILSISLNFNLLGAQTSLNVPAQAVSFWVAALAIFGATFMVSGLYLIYDWWDENR
jgi:ABC-type Na+ efflux pump permease subunit